MAGDVEMQDLPSSVLDDEKAVELLKRQSRHREKVERGDHLAVIMEEGQPGFPRVTSTTNLPQVSSHGPFRLLEPELLQLPWIFGAPQPAFSSAIRRMSRRISSVILGRPPRGRERQRQYKRKPAMPADDSLGLDHDEDFSPARPEL
jgi:hypothetical protein